MMAHVLRYHLLSLMILSIFGVLVHTALWAEEASKGVDHDQGGRIVIHSDNLEIDNRQRVVTFTGHINAEMEDFVIHCEKMLLYYLEASPSKGSEGENIQIKQGKIYINGAALTDPLFARHYYNQGAYARQGLGINVPSGNFYVLGDNSASSQDSRYWGFVPENYLLGKAFLIYWPLHRIRIIR